MIIAGCVNGVCVDVCDLIEYDVSLEIIIMKDEVDGLEIVCYLCVYLFGYVLK